VLVHRRARLRRAQLAEGRQAAVIRWLVRTFADVVDGLADDNHAGFRLFHVPQAHCRRAKVIRCSVSTCNSGKIKLVFCSPGCWDSHLPNARLATPISSKKSLGRATSITVANGR